MAWCPNCSGEYIDGVTTCYKCNVDLVDEPVEMPAEEIASERNKKPFEKEVFLVNVNSVVELAYITSMLENMNIHFRVIEKDIGQYLSIRHGKSYLGKSIYVEEGQLETAQEADDSFKAQFEKHEELDLLVNMDKTKRRRVFAGIVLVIIIFGLIFFGVAVG